MGPKEFAKVAFRISLAHTKEPYAISAWLRKGDLQASELPAPLTETAVRSFARKFNTHPAIIIGRLQHDELIPYGLGRQFFKLIEFK